jgi:tripartite-type tricarboxylate transporter receptor subunit TctC
MTAAAYPSRPISMIVPFAAGGAGDVIGRVLAEGMRGSLGQPVVVENVSGAEGRIGTGRAAHAMPDGYTIMSGCKLESTSRKPFDVYLDPPPVQTVTPSQPLRHRHFLTICNRHSPKACHGWKMREIQ